MIEEYRAGAADAGDVVAVKQFTVHDVEYRALVAHMQATFEARIAADGNSLFRTSIQAAQAEYAVDPSVKEVLNTGENAKHPVSLNMVYLGSLTDEVHYHTCSCCTSFLKHYGGLATIDAEGGVHAAFWDASTFPTDNFYYPVVKNIQAVIERGRIVGAHRAQDARAVWGEFVKGNFEHFAINVPTELRFTDMKKTGRQKQAELLEDYKGMAKGLSTLPIFSIDTLTKLMQLLNSEALAGAEKIQGAGRWLYKLAAERQAAASSSVKHNLLWRSIGSAPAGWAHSKNNVISTVLDDIVDGVSFAALAKKYGKKTRADVFRQPTAAPTAGAVDAAEKLVADNGLAPSFRRRVATLDDFPERAFKWRPSAAEVEQAEEQATMFGHLKTKSPADTKAELDIPAVIMSWNKFEADILPTAQSIQIYVDATPNFFTGYLTAAVADSPPILFHDHPEARNQVTDYTRYTKNPFSDVLHGISPQHWNLEPAKFYPVQALVWGPKSWGPGVYPQVPPKLTFVIEKAYDLLPAEGKDKRGLALFPEDLRSDLHSISRVVKAFSDAGYMEGDYPNQVVGLAIMKGGKFAARRLKVKTDTGTRDVIIDRWE